MLMNYAPGSLECQNKDLPEISSQQVAGGVKTSRDDCTSGLPVANIKNEAALRMPERARFGNGARTTPVASCLPVRHPKRPRCAVRRIRNQIAYRIPFGPF